MFTTRAWIVGGTFFVALSARAIAGCAASTSGAAETTADLATADGGASDSGPHCHNPRLHPVDGTTGPFCPFQAAGHASTCALGEHCCEPEGTTSIATCAATACALPDGGSEPDFQCDATKECPSGQVCCFDGAVEQSSTPGCNELVGTAVRGSVCRSSCAATEVPVCAQASDCAQGTCTPIYTRGKNLGLCR